MEGCPRLPAISFDPKISIEPVNICEKIPNYITTTYQENGEKYASECEQMNRLRQNAMNASIDESGLQILKRYYCQLQLLRNRFPMLPETECAVRFTWEDAYQKEDVPYNDIRYEEACILYNIGAIYSRLGANEARRTHDSIKNACTYFRCAAACFEKVRDQYTTYTSDLTPELLTCQVHILLAQAHEAVLEKSLLDQRAASVTAHVAMQISEYYQMALLNLTKPGINSIISRKFREWRVALTYKLSYYLAVTYFCSGLVADENKKRGEAVCYYENAVERLKEAWKNAEKISSDKTNLFKDAHIFTNDVIMGKYKIAKRDNDSVYFEKVPTLASLPAIQGAIVAKSQAFDCHDPEVCGVDVFQKLVPLDAHLAASEYSEEKAKLLREIIELTENKNRELETFMLCLQLNRIPLNNEYLRLPRDLLDCCAAVSIRTNMSKDLVAAMQQLNSQHHEVTDLVNEFEELLKTLDDDNNESIKNNKEYKDLQQNLKNIREMLIQANESNIELHRHMTTIIDHLKILQSPLEQLEKTLPIITELDDESNKPKIARLALLNEKVETMKKQREMLINDFRKKIQDDDITKLVLMQRQENNHKNLFSDQIKKHEELRNIIKQNCLAQDNILQSLTEANADIADIRTKIGNIFDARNRLIQEYINSFKSFEDTLAKAHEGIEFYKKQSAKLTKLIERLNTLKTQYQPPIPAPVQIPPRSSLHRQIPPTMPSRQSPLPTWTNPEFQEPDLPPSTMPDRPRLKDYLAAMKPDTWGSNTTGRPSKRSSLRREEIMYTPPPPSLPNLPDNNQFYANTTSAAGPLYSTMPSTAGPTLTSIPNFSPRHYPEQSSTYLPPSNTQSMDRGATSLAQNYTGQSQVPYNTHPSQPMYQPNSVAQQPFHQPPPAQQTIRQPSPTPTPQLGYQTPPPQQSIYQPPPVQQPSYHSALPPQPVYQPPPQQPIYQPPPPPQPVYQPPPPPQQPVYQPPQQPQQPVYQPPQQPQQPVYQPPQQPQQPVYQPPQQPQQPVYQPPVQIQQPVYQPSAQLQQPVYQPQVPPQSMYQQPMYQVPPIQHPSFVQQPSLPQQVNQQQIVQTQQINPAQQIPQQQPTTYQNQLPNDPNRSTQQPTTYQNQLPNDPNRSTQQPLPQAKFDPYRPQPLGTYDIPKSLNQPTATNPQPPAAPQNIPTQPRMNPQDVYRPGGLLTTNQTPMPSLSINNNNYDPNQFVQYTPSPPPPQPPPAPSTVPQQPPPAPSTIPQQPPPPPLVPTSTPVNVPVTPVPPQSSTSSIVDDLLSLALEQQANSSTIETELASPEPQSPPSIDEDLQPKSIITKPIACIQPLSMLNEEKTPVQQSFVTPVANLSSTQDPYDDKEKLDQLAADVQRFEKHVSTMTKKTLNGTVPLEVEWKELSDLQEKDVHTQTCAIGKCNPKLNRFQDLIPYDNSRVRLVQTNPNQQKHFNDYINATSIDRIRDTALLVAQYPLSTTVADYWSMIYDQHVAIVVVLLRSDELQTVNVYPQKIGEEMKVSSFTITLLSTKSPSTLTNHRILRVQHSQTNQSRTVVWLEHLGWPPKEMPDNPYELLKFIDEVQHYLHQTRNRRNTILATCLNGVSRTGPFLTLFTCIQDINEGRTFPDLNKIIRLLRSKRRHILNDMNQLKFIYEAFLFYLQDFLVKRGVLKVGSMVHHQTSSSNIKTISPIILLENEMQTIMDKAKPSIVNQSVPNYDVGPILSSNFNEEKSVVKQLTAIEENFNLRPEESHIKPKTKRDDFFRTKSTQDKDPSDPFNQLDPLWTYR